MGWVCAPFHLRNILPPTPTTPVEENLFLCVRYIHIELLSK